jgi:hypothetical protein
MNDALNRAIEFALATEVRRKMLSAAFGLLIVFAFAGPLLHGQAQEAAAVSQLPDAPSPALHTSSSVPNDLPPRPASAENGGGAIARRAVKPPTKAEVRGFRISEGLVAVGFFGDMKSTWDTINHPQHVRYRTYCTESVNGGPMVPIGLCGPYVDEYFPGSFQEMQWARFMGPRNKLGVGGANGVADVLIEYGIRHLLYAKGHPKVAVLANAIRAGTRMGQACLNEKYIGEEERNLIGRPPQDIADVQWYNP